MNERLIYRIQYENAHGDLHTVTRRGETAMQAHVKAIFETIGCTLISVTSRK